MRTQIVLLALLSAAAAPVLSQVPTSAAVMRIDPATQRQRDQTRAAILLDELVVEAQALSDAQKHIPSAVGRTDAATAREATHRVARHRHNISALAKELSAAERQIGVPAAKTQAATAAPVPQRMAEEWLPGVPAARGSAPSAARRSAPEQGRPGVWSSTAPEWFIPAAPPGMPDEPRR